MKAGRRKCLLGRTLIPALQGHCGDLQLLCGDSVWRGQGFNVHRGRKASAERSFGGAPTLGLGYLLQMSGLVKWQGSDGESEKR